MLTFLGRHARWVLPAGLLAGWLLPQLASPLLQLVPACIVALLYVACLRIRLDRFRGFAELTASLPLVLLLQLLLPLLAIVVLKTAGVALHWQLPVILVCAAAPITGSPNIVLMLGGNASLALRTLILGTAMLPLTALPILLVAFPGVAVPSLLSAVLRLLALITLAVLLALGTLWLAHGRGSRAAVLPWLATRLTPLRLDGTAALLLVVMVIGLMAALHREDATAMRIASLLMLAFALNLALQWFGGRVGRWSARERLQGGPAQAGDAAAIGVMCGNRNIALFLSAMPGMLSDDFLLFMACYQIPMYLSPLLGSWLYPRTCSA